MCCVCDVWWGVCVCVCVCVLGALLAALSQSAVCVSIIQNVRGQLQQDTMDDLCTQLLLNKLSENTSESCKLCSKQHVI